jgi:hypothetical protein
MKTNLSITLSYETIEVQEGLKIVQQINEDATKIGILIYLHKFGYLFYQNYML